VSITPLEIPFHSAFASRIPPNATAGHDTQTKADVAAIAPVAGWVVAGFAPLSAGLLVSFLGAVILLAIVNFFTGGARVPEAIQ